MGRRKQQQPQPNVGRVEDRPEEPEEPENQVHENPEFDLDEWEEQNAQSARPRKRHKEPPKRKGYTTTSTGVLAAVHELSASEDQEWAFSELEIVIQGENAATVSQNATSLLEAQQLSISQEDTNIYLWKAEDNVESPWGCISMPSEELAVHFKTCLAATIALGPLSLPLGSRKLPLGNDAGPSTSKSADAPLKSLKCTVGIKPVAFAKLSAGWAEDTPRGSLPLLQILRCLVVPARGSGSSLDPDLDFPEDNEDIVHSPLCSPRSKAAAGERGAFSPHSAAAAAAGGAGAAAAAAAASFDASEIYAAVKPTGQEDELTTELPQLQPTLRGYQRRAAQWMINREQFGSEVGSRGGSSSFLHPLWREVPCLSSFSQASELPDDLETINIRKNKKQKKNVAPEPPAIAVPEAEKKRFYVNIYTGLLSSEPFPPPPGPKGGIASDEMGLGKTVELLALVVGNPYRGPAPTFATTEKEISTPKAVETAVAEKKSKKRAAASKGAASPSKSNKKPGERIDCPCGAYDSDDMDEEGYEGLWLMCSECLAWQHGVCCGFPKRAPTGNFTCQQCLRKKASIGVTQPCGTTLVVCPAPILAQWKEEITRHVQPGALKVVVYDGQPQPRPGQKWAASITTAADLAAADIVLTTYDVLKKDLHHDSDAALASAEGEEEEDGDDDGGGGSTGRRMSNRAAGFSLRRRRRYEIIPTPLTRLRFWRVAIDEAQLVESSTAKAAAMALKLHTEHRWCVTGTPLSRGLEDLQGLMAFLKVQPYADKFWWKRVIQQPYEAGSRAARARLLQLLRPAVGGLLWRSAKADVKNELGIPPQHHHLTNLKFSAIERHFYARQHQDCVGAASAALSTQTLSAAQAAARAMLSAATAAKTAREPLQGGNKDVFIDDDIVIVAPEQQQHHNFEDRSLTQREEHKLLHPLIRLRQACVHPQVGAGGIRALSQSRTPMTMSEVLETLLAKATVEAEDAQRMVLASLNGLAGLLLLQGHVGEAVRAYREAIKLVEENRIYIRADKLQQLHTLHNLAAVLAGPAQGDGSIARTLRDDSLSTEATKLRDEYLNEAVTRLAAADYELQEVRTTAAKAVSEFQRLAGPKQAPALLTTWWIDAIHLLTRYTNDHGAQVVSHIKAELAEADGYRRTTERNAVSIASKFRDLMGLQVILKTELDALQTAQSTALTSFQQLSNEVGNPSSSLVALAASCTRCRTVDPSTGTVCKHCHLDQKLVGWESRLYTLIASAMEAGGAVSVEDAALAEYNQQINRRAGRGGLGENDNLTADGGTSAGASGSGRRSAAGISRTVLVHTASQAEKALQMLAHHLRTLHVPTGAVAEQRDLLVAAAKAQLDGLDAAKKEFMKVRAVALQQRLKLYALDELEMCVMRMQVRAPYEHLSPSEELYKIHEAEIPVKSTELSADKAVSAAELRRCLGTLRYLQGLKAEQERLRAGAALGNGSSPQKQLQLGNSAAAGDANPGGSSARARRKEEDSAGGAGAPAPSLENEQQQEDLGVPADQPQCPICQEVLGREQCMLPCGHRLCCRCQLHLAEQIPVFQPQESKRFGCPTCRARVRLVEVAYIDTEKELEEEEQVEEGVDLIQTTTNTAAGAGAGAGGGGANGGASGSKEQNPLTSATTNGTGSTLTEYAILPSERSIRVRGSYGTKLEAVVRRLVSITQTDSSARVLVFSSWKDALELVAHALTANGVSHLYPKSGKTFDAALKKFREGHERQLALSSAAAAAAGAGGGSRPNAPAAASAAEVANADKLSPRILLLLMKQGGNGLNLQQAQHVVFIEPILDPAEEAQAVGRVDRIGQTKATHVHRFVVQHSIEENVHRLGQHRAAAMDLAAAAVRRGKAAGDRGALTLRDVAVLLQEDTGGLMGSEEHAALNN
jgi:E3 ubiquitin-protein ligase SHPRH